MGAVAPPWEVGGDFHWEAPGDGPTLSLPDGHVLFSVGRGVMLTVARAQLTDDERLFVPDYFCPHTLAPLREAGIRLQTYVDRPGALTPEWGTLDAAPGDMVMAVNFFGASDGIAWRDWSAAHPGVVMLEDHTHDPWSPWASASTADFAFASLRKTMPIPDGAVLWSPRGHPLPSAPICAEPEGAQAKLRAMQMKAAYLAGDPSVDKASFRALQLRGEELMDAARTWGISPASRARIEAGFSAAWRTQRASNVAGLFARTAATDRFTPVIESAPGSGVLLGAPLRFVDARARDAARSQLTRAQVYCPIHWRLEQASEASLRLSQRVLTVPLDQRVGADDVERIASILLGVTEP